MSDDHARTEAKARAAYRDDRYPARFCDHCGQVYQGPAVYCSLDCAIADAGGPAGISINRLDDLLP